MINYNKNKKNEAEALEKIVSNLKMGLGGNNADIEIEDNLIVAPLAFDGKIVNRVATVSGHMTAIRNMINEHREVEEVLDQIVAVEKSVLRIKREIIKNHINSNVMNDAELTNDAKLSYINELLNKYLK